MDYKKITRLFLMLAFGFSVSEAQAQVKENLYDISFRPDVWFNTEDGIRLGLVFKGDMPNRLDGGLHRLDAGIWFGTWVPEHPVSYYISLTEPLFTSEDLGSYTHLVGTTTARTGYSKHKIEVKNRIQPGFNEFNYIEFAAGFSREQRFENRYVQFASLWQNEWKSILDGHVGYYREFSGQAFSFTSDFLHNFENDSGTFSLIQAEIKYLFKFSDWMIRARAFTGLSSSRTAPEYRYTPAFAPAIEWLDSGITRARGPVPQRWLEAGTFHYQGGANLRGYTNQTIEALQRGELPLYTGFSSVNLELDIPDFSNTEGSESVFSDIVNFKTYFFFDAGTSPGLTKTELSKTLADAGIGFVFRLNHPDAWGKPRGLYLRYEIPFWLSRPSPGDKEVEFRQLIGFGAIIPF